MTTKQAVKMNPTSDMPLDDIIRELEARRDKAREDMLAFVVEGVKSGRLSFERTDYDDEDADIILRPSDMDASGEGHEETSTSQYAYIRRRLGLGEELDQAADALSAAVNLRDTLEGRE